MSSNQAFTSVYLTFAPTTTCALRVFKCLLNAFRATSKGVAASFTVTNMRWPCSSFLETTRPHAVVEECVPCEVVVVHALKFRPKSRTAPCY